MPEDRSVAFPASHCPTCGTPIKPYDNVPVLAWFWLGGRCRACKETISGLYPTVEALGGVFAILLFRRVVPDLGDLDVAHLAAFAWYGWLLFALLGLTFIDLRHQIIPDEFSMYSVPVGVAGAALLGWLGYVGAPTWQQSVIGALCGGLFLGAISIAARLYYGFEAMGWGDVKLLALLGAYFGALPALPTVLILASMTASIVGVVFAAIKRKSLKMGIPLGPFLALAAVVWLFFSEHLPKIGVTPLF